jgi:hypothetical protein
MLLGMMIVGLALVCMLEYRLLERRSAKYVNSRDGDWRNGRKHGGEALETIFSKK